jgi:hypothetical protein
MGITTISKGGNIMPQKPTGKAAAESTLAKPISMNTSTPAMLPAKEQGQHFKAANDARTARCKANAEAVCPVSGGVC